MSQNLVITEIMYNPPESGTDSLEFIEIFNFGSSTEFVGNYSFTSGLSGAFPAVNIPSGGYIILCSDSLRFAQVYGVSGAYVWSGGLSNSGETIVFVDGNGNTVDSVDYDNGGSWPGGAANGNGHSIVFCDSLNINTNPSAWFLSSDTISGLIVNSKQIVASPGSYEDGACANFTCTNVIVNLTATIDLGDSILLGGSYQFDAGTYTDTYPLSNGCDSVVNTTLTVDIDPSPFLGDIVITEIMYNPPEAGNDSLEFIEIYNASNATISLDGFYFYKGIEYTFPQFTGLAAGAYMTFSVETAPFVQVYSSVPYDQWINGSLGNNGDEIILVDQNNLLVDEVNYATGGVWPGSGANGNGKSIVLCDPLSDNDDGSNWTLSSDSIPNAVINGIQIYASPGTDDLSCLNVGMDVNLSDNFTYLNPINNLIEIRWDERKRYNSIELFDLQGKLINQETLNSNTITMNASQLESGIYIVHLSGEIERKTIKLLKK